METNQVITQIITMFQVLVPLGAIARISACLVAMSMDSDSASSHKLLIRNAIIFTVLAESITGLLRIFSSYYK